MRTLVTGGDGFVGQHLISHLLGTSREVAATILAERAADGTLSNAERGAVVWYRADVVDRDSVRAAVERWLPDEVFHLAGFASGAAARERPTEAVRVNVGGTLNTLEAVADSAASRFVTVVVAGSADAYGPPDETGAELTESTPLRPGSAYGGSKAGQERVACAVAAARRLDVRIARLFPLVGPGQSENFVVPSFCRQASRIASGDRPAVLRVGNLDAERDFTHVRDGVRALEALAGLDGPQHTTYNVCSEIGVRIGTVLDWILEEAGVRPTIEVDPARLRPDEPRRIVGSAERLRRETGWRVEHDVREGVRETYHWVRGRPEGDLPDNGHGEGRRWKSP